ncbi:hypothetical protein GCM10009595_05840 [Falsarthrobacter nasiphocae]|nr:Sec-independent protein translocase subunit TatA [Falsarthrobacter nasiphocae]
MGWAQPSHILIVVVLVLLLFGAPKLPQLARSVGESMRVFRSEVKQLKNEEEEDEDNPKTPGTGAGATGTGSTSADTPVTGRVIDGNSK